jgi:hypothetical protein
MEELKGAVKSLINLWASCMLLQQQHEQQQGVDGHMAPCLGSSSSSQQAWQGLIPALATSVEHLLHMCVTSADYVSTASSLNPSSQQVPREMCTMSALNLSWANLTRLLVAIPASVRMQVLGAQDLLRGLNCALQQLHAAVADLSTQARER